MLFQLLIFTYNPKRAKKLWQHRRSQPENKFRSLEMCSRRETLQREEQQSEPGLILSEVILCHYNLAQAGKSVLPRDAMGRQHLASKGQPGVVSWDPLVLCMTLQSISPRRVHHRHLYIWSTHIYHEMGVQEGICTPSTTPAVLLRFFCWISCYLTWTYCSVVVS